MKLTQIISAAVTLTLASSIAAAQSVERETAVKRRSGLSPRWKKGVPVWTVVTLEYSFSIY